MSSLAKERPCSPGRMCPSCAPPPLASSVVFGWVQNVGRDIHRVKCLESRA